MSWEVEFTPRALRDTRRMDSAVMQRIAAAITRVSREESSDSQRLRGPGRRWRLRVGDWRVIFRYERRRRKMVILRIGHRREIYRG